MEDQTRREFLQKLAAAAAGVGLCHGVIPFRAKDFTGGLRADLIRPPAFADLHAHPLLNQWIRSSALGRQMPLVADVAAKMLNKTKLDFESSHRAGIDLMCVAHFNLFDEWASMPTDPNPNAPVNTFHMMDLLEQAACGESSRFMRVAHNHLELESLLKIPKGSPEFRVAALHALEGGHALGGSLEPLDELARRGVAMITITHFFNKGIATSGNAYPFFPDAFSDWPKQGLSSFGKEVISEMEKRGIIVDLAHATSTAIEDALKTVTRPVVSSHISARTLGEHPYSLVDEHIEEIARCGGLIGVIIMPYWLSNYSNERLAVKYGGLRDVVRTVEYVAKLTGSLDHVGIGSDFGGYITGPNDMKRLGEINELRKALLEAFSPDEVNQIMAGNTMRFILEHWRSGLNGSTKCT